MQATNFVRDSVRGVGQDAECAVYLNQRWLRKVLLEHLHGAVQRMPQGTTTTGSTHRNTYRKVPLAWIARMLPERQAWIIDLRRARAYRMVDAPQVEGWEASKAH